MKRYLVVIISKEIGEICYDVLTETEYKTLSEKQTQKEKQDFLLAIEEKNYVTYYSLDTLFQIIDNLQIKIMDTYTMYWE